MKIFQAFKAIHGFVQKLEKASENPDLIPEMEAEVNAGSGSGLLAGTSVPSWAEWALGAVGAKFYKSAAPPKSEAPAAKENQKPNANEIEPIKSSVPSVTKPQSPLKIEPVAKKQQEVEGWGELEDDDEGDEGDWGSMEPTQPSKAAPSTNKSIGGGGSAGSGGGGSGGSGGWDVDDEDADADWGDMNDFSGGSAASSSNKFGAKSSSTFEDLKKVKTRYLLIFL